jgi:hypothetical protein
LKYKSIIPGKPMPSKRCSMNSRLLVLVAFLATLSRTSYGQRTGMGGDGGSCSEEELMQWALDQGVYADKVQAADFAFEAPANSSLWTDRSVCYVVFVYLAKRASPPRSNALFLRFVVIISYTSSCIFQARLLLPF